jgi:YcaO-like protein with predicted kinase domain
LSFQAQLTETSQSFHRFLHSITPILENGHALSHQQAYLLAKNWAARSGVKRVAECTGLDRLQVPNFYAVRPSARHRSAIVSSGRGLSREAALLSSLFECFERWAAEEYPGPIICGSVNSLQWECPGLKVAYSLDTPPDRQINWAAGFDLISKKPCLSPLNSVVFPPQQMSADGSIQEMTGTTNGLCAGVEPLEAICSGVLELIERDAVARLDLDHLALVDHETLPEPVLELVRRFDANAIELAIVRCRSRAKVPVYYALAADEHAGLASFFCSGSAAAAGAADALLQTLTEVSQSRAASISSLRDDVGIRMRAFDPISYGARRSGLAPWFSKLNLESFAPDGEFLSESFLGRLDELLRRIEAGYPEPVVSCTSLRSFSGLFAFRLYCPQMIEPRVPTSPQL